MSYGYCHKTYSFFHLDLIDLDAEEFICKVPIERETV